VPTVRLRANVNEEAIKEVGQGRKGQSSEKDSAGLEIILSVRAFYHDREVVLNPI
jgi:hypothetical protein